MHTGKELEVH